MHVKPCKKAAAGGVWAAITRHGAAFGLQKDGTELHLGCEKTARSYVWAVERLRAAEYVLQQEFYHVPYSAPKHVPMQEKHLAHTLPTPHQNTFPCKKSTLHMQFYRYAMHYKIMVDFALREYFNREQFITEETVDAEITVVMPVQRIHGAEMWIRNKLSNGPLRA